MELWIALSVCFLLSTAVITGLASDVLSNGEVSVLKLQHLLGEEENTQGMFQTILTALSNDSIPHEVSASPYCLNDTRDVFAGILNGHMNAVKFLDSDFKLGSGILEGNIVWIGDYEECISASYTIHKTKKTIDGKYFSVQINTKQLKRLPFLTIGVCLPHSCSRTDATILLNASFSLLNKFSLGGVYEAAVPELSTEAIVVLVVLFSVCMLVATGTFLDVFTQHVESNNRTVNENGTNTTGNDIDKQSKADRMTSNRKQTIIGIFKSFSLVLNSRKLFNTSTAEGPLACLNGLRVISMFWVILGHTYLFSKAMMQNSLYMETKLKKMFSFQPIVNGTYSVDTFFFLSGLLVAFLALKEVKSKGKLNWWYYFLHRIWRLTPMYAFTLMFHTTLIGYVIHGPFRWLLMDPNGPFHRLVDSCRHYWWVNLLYFNNFYPNHGSLDNCLGWTWYLANDMQFYVFLAPVIIICLRKKEHVGIFLSVCLVLICIFCRGILANYYGMNQFREISKHEDDAFAISDPMYQRPYTRLATYVVGMLTGYLLHKINFKLRFTRLVIIGGWVVSSTAALLLVYGLFYYYHNPGTNMSQAGSVLFLAISRTSWALCLSWLVIACASGNGGFVNWLLSLKFWAPLGRLTYCAYLLHPIVTVVCQFNFTSTIHFSQVLPIYLFIGNVFITYGFSFIASISVEAPMMQIEKLILSR